MSVHDPVFITFNGEAVPGRVPARLVVEGDRTLTPQQRGAVAKLYQEFRRTLDLSLLQQQQERHVLPDGTKVLIQSLQGVDTVRVNPPGPEPNELLVEWFRGVSTSDTYDSGQASTGPSASWRMPGAPTEMPPQLKPQSTLELHPGHVTWSNPNLKRGGFPIVVSWRGPRDRYSSSHGWSSYFGGTIASFESSIDLGDDVLKDSGYVWINGRRIDTGKLKVIAACLHEFDPVDEPNKFVLRILSDMYPQPSTTRKLVCFDLVATDGAIGSSLQALAEANEMFEKAVYEPTDFVLVPDAGDPVGSWDYSQRPHFNRTGDRIATIINRRDPAYGTPSGVARIGATFNPTTWALDQTVLTPYTSTETATETTPAPDTYHREVTTEVDVTNIVAVDFDGDTLVHVTYSLQETVTREGDFKEGEFSTYSVSTTAAWTLDHSSIGELGAGSESGTATGSYVVTDLGGGNYSVEASFNDYGRVSRRFVVVGDLSKGTFAIGESGTIRSERADASLSYSGADASQDTATTVTTREERWTFDVYLDGTKVADDTTGSFTNEAESGTTSPTVYGAFDTGGLSYGAATGTTTTTYTANPGNMISAPKYDSLHSNVAVNARRRAAYFGVTAPDFDPVLSGLEIAVFKDPDGTVHVDSSIPAYQTGDHPTISAPVFTGPATGAQP